MGGRGGAGASLFATALAQSARDALLVDADPWSGGIDLVVGTEDKPGLRWPDLALEHGRLDFAALRQALPRLDGLSVLSSVRAGNDVEPGPLAAVIDAGRRGGATVVCDLPRRLTRSVEFAVDAADLVVLVTTADVGGCARDRPRSHRRWARSTRMSVWWCAARRPAGLRSVDVAQHRRTAALGGHAAATRSRGHARARRSADASSLAACHRRAAGADGVGAASIGGSAA